MVNREHMEQWINALEAYDREPARGTLQEVGLDGEVRMCAVGIGLNAMKPGCLAQWIKGSVLGNWPNWLGIEIVVDEPFDVALKPDGSHFRTVVEANDNGRQSPWTIAQRLRETYLKEES